MRAPFLAATAAALTFTVSFARADEPAQKAASDAQLTTLNLLHSKGLTTDEELESAKRDIAPSTGDRAAEEANTLKLGRCSATLYGFLEADHIYDSTESFNEQIGNAQVERPDPHPLPPPAAPVTYRGDHGRMTFSIRNSRFGLRLGASTGSVRPSATLEMDFLGPLPTGTEAAQFTTPVLRLRHGYFKLETPVLDVMLGQYWRLFGWQGMAFPGTVQIIGMPGQLYSRTQQIRLSKTVHAWPLALEIAAAASRPVQRDGVRPDFEEGVRIAYEDWTAAYTGGATASSLAPLALGVSGIHRQVVAPEFDPLPKNTVSKSVDAIAVDLTVPVLPATKEHRGNSLVLLAEAVTGSGIADLYSGLTGGVAFPTVANTTGINPPPTYPQNVDNGIVVYDLDGNLYPVRWRSLLAGLQYTLPVLDGRVWVTGNYSHLESPNSDEFTRPVTATLPNPLQSYYVSAAQVRDSVDYFDVNAFVEPIDGVRFGAGYANMSDKYVDGIRAVNHRGQISGYFIF
jgi:hypothetical protein